MHYGRDFSVHKYLCAVRLSQKVMLPSVPRVRTQACGEPLALAPTHTYASRPKPSRRLHSRVAWSSQSPWVTEGGFSSLKKHFECLKTSL